MKIFSLLASSYPCAPDPDITYLIADSALTKGGKPFFLPDAGAPYAACPALVIPVSRLGKSVSARFAPRYYKEIHSGVLFRAEGRLDVLRAKGCPLSDALSFDGALNMGDCADTEIRWRMGSEEISFRIDDAINDINRYIEIISRQNMIRIGDLVVFPVARFDTPPAENVRIEAFSGDRRIHGFNIK